MEEIKTKICTKCGEEKPATTEWFRKEPKTKSGIASRCKKCVYSHAREYRQENLEKERERHRIYYKKNQEAMRERSRVYHKKNRKERIEKNRRWRKDNPQKIKRWRKIRTKRDIETLSNNYVKMSILNRYGIRFSEITPEFIQAKREQLQNYRELKDLKENANN